MTLTVRAVPVLPVNPLDDIIHRLGGPNRVAELSGRSGRMERFLPGLLAQGGRRPERPPWPPHSYPRPIAFACSLLKATYRRPPWLTGSYHPRFSQRGAAKTLFRYTKRKGTDEKINIEEKQAFQDGDKKIAIITDACSTGISLHANVREKNQCRRVHITIELPWAADTVIQQFGRTHRSNQTSAPEYKLLITKLGGENRFAAGVAYKMQRLGALTKGDSRAEAGSELGSFNFDSSIGREALDVMITNIQARVGVECSSLRKRGMLPAKVANDDDLREFRARCSNGLAAIRMHDAGKSLTVTRFLGRLLGLDHSTQNTLFDYFAQTLEVLRVNVRALPGV